MSKYLVTGASGQIGRKTLQHLLERVPTGELVGLVRDPAKAADLAAAGIEIRAGDYFDHGSLLRAFDGVDKVLLVSTHAFTDRVTQHLNVITAAREAGVGHVLYTPIIRKEGSGFVMPEVTGPDISTEQALKESGLAYTILGHPPFMESFQAYVGDRAYDSGVRVPAGDGKVGPATRDDLAEAQAVLLSEEGHENKTYALLGAPVVSFAEVAEILSEIRGEPVPYIPVTDEEFFDGLIASGVPRGNATFWLAWMQGINSGEWDGPSDDLEQLIGHGPTTVAQYLREHYARLHRPE